MSTKYKRLFTFEESAFSTTASTATALSDMISRFMGLNATIDEQLKGIADDCLVSLFEGKGKKEGSAFVLKSLLGAMPWEIRRFVPAIRAYLTRAGLTFDGVVPKTLRAPETSGITEKSTVEEYKAFLASLDFVEKKDANKTDEEKAKEAKAEAAKIKKQWKGEEGQKRFVQYLINASENLKEKNKAFANDLFLFACNYDAVKQVFATMAADHTLNRKSPIEVKKARKAK